jgi:hypothetical protein
MFKINKFLFRTVLILTFFLLSSCSVYLATTKKTGDVNMMFACRTRTCLINQGALPVQQKRSKKGILTKELFKAHMPHNSDSRALMHGVMDCMTLGLWEVAATPVEAIALEKRGIYFFQVDYKEDGETIQKMDLYKDTSPHSSRRLSCAG